MNAWVTCPHCDKSSSIDFDVDSTGFDRFQQTNSCEHCYGEYMAEITSQVDIDSVIAIGEEEDEEDEEE